MKRYNRLYGLNPISGIRMSVLLFVAAFISFPAVAFSEGSQSDVVEYTAIFDYGSLAVEENAESTGEVYSYLVMPDLDRETIAGAPDIPVRYLSFLVPSYSKDFRVSLISCDKGETIGLNHDLVPVQEDHDMNTINPPFTLPDMSLYGDRSDIEVRILGEQFFEGWQHLVNVAIRPIAYDYADRQIRCYNNLKIKLEYTPCEGNEMASPPVFPPEPQYSPLLADLVVNPPTVSSDGITKAPAVTQEVKERYLIVTDNYLKSGMEKFAIWKRQKGYTVDIATMESILSTPGYAVNPADSIWDEAAALRKWLKNKYETIGFQYLLLAGDSRNGNIPVRKYYNVSGEKTENQHGEKFIPSDVYFVDFSTQLNALKKHPNGVYSTEVSTALNPALPVGRLMCRDNEELSNYLRKLQIYEAWPGKGETGYLGKGLTFVQQDGITTTNGKRTRWCNNIFDPLSNYFDSKEMLDSIWCEDFANRRPTGAQVINELKKVGLMSWQGHGCPGSIATAGRRPTSAEDSIVSKRNKVYSMWRFIQPVKTTELTGLSHSDPNNSLDLLGNDYQPGVAYSISCHIMPFDLPEDGKMVTYHFGTAYTVAGRYGGVALLGNTRQGWWGASSKLEKKFGELLINNRKAGVAEYLSKLRTNNSISHAALYAHNLIGDPEFEIWLGEPVKTDYLIQNKNNGYSVSGNLQGCIISSYNGIRNIRSDKVVMSNGYSVVNIDINDVMMYDTSQDRLISVWKPGYLPVMRLCADNVTLSNVTKTYSMPVIDISSSGSIPCKFNLAYGGTLKLMSATDIHSDGAVDINGGSLILEGENVSITGSNKFTGGELTVKAETVSFDGEFEIDGCIVELNCR